MRPIFYDLETTGVKSETDRIIEIAAYDPVQERTFVEFVNPQMQIPKESTAITGITNDMVASAQTFKEVAPRFLDFVDNSCVLIAHNNDGFDKHFLHHEYIRAGLKSPSFTYLDSLKWARKYRPDLPKHALQYLREVYNIEKNSAHRALDDVMVLYKVFTFMTDDLPIETCLHLLTKKETIKVMPFGKHKGKPIQDLPKSYATWLLESGALDKPQNEALKESFENCNFT